MKISNAFFKERQKWGTVKYVHGFLKTHCMHITYFTDDTCVLRFQDGMESFIVTSCS